MARIAVITDTVSCLPDEVRQEYSISVVPLRVHFGTESYLSTELSLDEFYRRLPKANPLPTTSTPSMGQYQASYREAVEKGAQAIVVISVSGGVSATYSAALAAAHDMDGLDIRVVDSRTALMAQGFLALEAARAAEAGATPRQLMDRIQELIPRVHLFITMDTLEYLRRGGRVGGAQALLASALRIKPSICIPTDRGTVQPLGRSHTRARALRDLVGRMAEAVGDRPVHVAVQQGASKPEEVGWLMEAVRERFDCRELYETGITPVIGTHTGPGTLALSFWAE